MEKPIKMDDLGGKPTIFGNTHMTPTQTMHYYFQEIFQIDHTWLHQV